MSPVMVGRHELRKAQREQMATLLPGTGAPGGRWADHRTVVNGVLYRTRTGFPRRDLPERYGSWQTVYECHRCRPADGTWSNIGRRGDSPMFIPPMQAPSVARTGTGRPRTRPDRTRGDNVTLPNRR
jgi:hypothetical protein